MKKKALFYLITLILMISGDAFAIVPESKEINVTVMSISGDWEATGDLQWQALLLSLQGIANKHGPHIYLVYADNYLHPDVKAVLEYYKNRHHIKTNVINSIEDAVLKYKKYLKGYVMWDTAVVPSLMVSFTVAGLEDALVVTDAYLPLVEKLGLRPIADFRDKFSGKSDLEIFKWAYDEYWHRCSRDYLVYLGERCKGLKGNPGMWPGIADFGIVHQTFFTDLSTSPADQDEYQLADKIMSEMKPYAYVFGWHSYCKDMETEHLTLVSRHSLIVAEGLATLPNMSFHSKMPVSPDFKFKQKAQVNPNPTVENKVYITMIQSDGMSTGSSWLKPGRGDIPYGWEANEEWMDVAPALLQFYYESATPNDQFVGSLSGPGYFYPKAYPPDKLAGALRLEDALMRRMDLHVFGIMDFSEGDEYVGNIDLPKNIGDSYYENMPYAIGFINGYTAGNTFDCRNGRPLISYNYYVDPQKPAEEVVEDLKELARINPKRPYFLPIHVRETNIVQRMKSIVDQLGSEFVVVLPEEFMIMASKKPTMTTRYLDYHPDFSGHWKLDTKQSKDIFASISELDIDRRGNAITITTTFRYNLYIHHRELKTTKTLIIGGAPVKSPEDLTRRMGYLAAKADSITTCAKWNDDGKTLILINDMNLETSQGFYPISSSSEYTLSPDGMSLTVTERRSSRQSDVPVAILIFRRIL